VDTTTIVIIVIVAVIVLAAIAWFAYQAKRRSDLKQTFGPEYDRTVDRTDDRKQAEADLRHRRERHDELDIRPLSPEQQSDYRERWHRIEASFIADPEGVARDADGLVQEVMRERGYPVDDRDHIEVLSVDHPERVERYRTALRTTEDPRSASTEELRQALLDLRETFEAVSGGDTDTTDRDRREGADDGRA
jgi:hypothetical protein